MIYCMHESLAAGPITTVDYRGSTVENLLSFSEKR
jgi:hypothetical protein